MRSKKTRTDDTADKNKASTKLIDAKFEQTKIIEIQKIRFKDKVYQTVVPRNVRLSEAPSHGIPVLLYDKICPGSKAYFKFTEEFLEQDKQVESAA